MEQVIFRFVKVEPKHTRIEVDDDAESIPPDMVIRALRDYADELEADVMKDELRWEDIKLWLGTKGRQN